MLGEERDLRVKQLLTFSSEMDWSDERSQGYLVNRGSSNIYPARHIYVDYRSDDIHNH